MPKLHSKSALAVGKTRSESMVRSTDISQVNNGIKHTKHVPCELGCSFRLCHSASLPSGLGVSVVLVLLVSHSRDASLLVLLAFAIGLNLRAYAHHEPGLELI